MQQVQEIISQVRKVVVGKDTVIASILMAMLAQGHVLLEDVPGVGKTTMALAFSRTMDLSYKRMQFTPDVMPSDITGYTTIQTGGAAGVYVPGAAMCNLFLADEINRASSKTQSALHEVMEENSITVDGVTRAVPQPFLVIATQNPVGSSGTQPLPESQLDRFLMRIELGYPQREAELQMLLRHQDAPLSPLLDAQQLLALQQAVAEVHATPALLEYLLALVNLSRQPGRVPNPLSPRASHGLLAAARAWAFLSHRDHVLPDDVQAVFAAVAEHRMRSGPVAIGSPASFSRALLSSVDPVQ